MAELSKSTILSNISTDLADNNAGLISAADVRNNIFNGVDSINAIVASGDTDVTYPFFSDVRAKVTGGVTPTGGIFIAESGLSFPNAPINDGELQVEPFLGVGNLQHNQLGELTTGDPHTQYLNIDGTRAMNGNLKLDDNWIGASGYNSDGFKFEYHPTGTTILTSGTMKFGDNSMFGSARGVAKAWINFDASGPTVRSAYNITALDDLGVGKFRITFASGVVGDNYFVAVGHSNATSASGSIEDFANNSVSMVSRSGVDPNKTMSFVVRDEGGQYVDAKINDIIVFADGPNVTTDSV